MSLLVPGSGEFYAQSYWKAAAFFAIEVAAWALAYTYDKKGDKQTDYFQNFANGNWECLQVCAVDRATRDGDQSSVDVARTVICKVSG